MTQLPNGRPDPLAEPCHHGNRYACGFCLGESARAGRVLGSPPRPAEGFNIMTREGIRAVMGAARRVHQGAMR